MRNNTSPPHQNHRPNGGGFPRVLLRYFVTETAGPPFRIDSLAISRCADCPMFRDLRGLPTKRLVASPPTGPRDCAPALSSIWILISPRRQKLALMYPSPKSSGASTIGWLLPRGPVIYLRKAESSHLLRRSQLITRLKLMRNRRPF